MSDPKLATPEMSGELAKQSGLGRRRLLRAGLATAPVILVTSGRSAFAQVSDCGSGLSPIAFLSAFPNGNCDTPAARSHTVSRNALGRSPGYWRPNCMGDGTSDAKTFQGPWPSGCMPFEHLTTSKGVVSWTPANWNSYAGLPKDIINDSGSGSGSGRVKGLHRGGDAGWNSGTVLAWLDTRSISRILIEESGTLKWHVCAAYLNALMSEQAGLSGSAGYALTTAEVKTIYETRQLNGVSGVDLKAFFNQTWI